VSGVTLEFILHGRQGVFVLKHATSRSFAVSSGNLCLHETAWWGWEASNF
jgi:hypothetical protein